MPQLPDCSLDPDLLLLDFRDPRAGKHCHRPGYRHDTRGTGGNKIWEPYTQWCGAGIHPRLVISARVHKEHLELDIFENMSGNTQTHAPMDVHSLVCFIYQKYSFMRENQDFGRPVASQKCVFIYVNSAEHMGIQIPIWSLDISLYEYKILIYHVSWVWSWVLPSFAALDDTDALRKVCSCRPLQSPASISLSRDLPS